MTWKLDSNCNIRKSNRLYFFSSTVFFFIGVLLLLISPYTGEKEIIVLVRGIASLILAQTIEIMRKSNA